MSDQPAFVPLESLAKRLALTPRALRRLLAEEPGAELYQLGPRTWRVGAEWAAKWLEEKQVIPAPSGSQTQTRGGVRQEHPRVQRHGGRRGA